MYYSRSPYLSVPSLYQLVVCAKSHASFLRELSKSDRRAIPHADASGGEESCPVKSLTSDQNVYRDIELGAIIPSYIDWYELPMCRSSLSARALLAVPSPAAPDWLRSSWFNNCSALETRRRHGCRFIKI